MSSASENGEELMEVILNKDGQDVTVFVDITTANILLNDPEEAEKYMNNEVLDTGCTEEEGIANNDTNTTSRAGNVWCSKRPSSRDNEATEVFLELRQKYAPMFDDKKHVKTQLWAKVAADMHERGFDVGAGRDAVEKLRQKFANLQKQYLKHIAYVKRTGEGKKDPPPFFSQLHDMLGHKDKTDPKNLQDTLEADSSEEEDAEATPPVDDNNVAIKNRFKINTGTNKPSTSNRQLIDLLQKQHEEDTRLHEQQFDRLASLLKEQNQQRDRLLNQFEILVKTTKKRSHSTDSE